MADVRRRALGTTDPATDPKAAGYVPKSADSVPSKIQAEDDSSARIKVTDILRILGGLALLNCTLSYFITGDSFGWGYRPWWSKPTQVSSWVKGPLQLTDAQLAAYDGSDPSKPIYLAINGTIYDVTSGPNYYGPGGMYGFFSGKDAARAFVTGCFQEDLNPDLRGVEEMYIPLDDPEEDAKLSKGEIKTRRERELRLAKKEVKGSLAGWEKLFSGATGKNYFKVGEVIREKDWLKNTPKPTLCEAAQKKRKVRGAAAAAKPAGGPPV
ncbi:cytochrome b5 [Myriangium duriaei CBS 260.36]|uniref:Cytochrome b5 n=1 Tax=Myriangium duriaei CBS 260.36 TaxID=1168546 RepID=A0A9P4IX77_9PEZI|nr:cytochrome b5 [Myriangium duriaei CBS 260.36]